MPECAVSATCALPFYFAVGPIGRGSGEDDVNDLAGFLRAHPSVQLLAFNGAGAAKSFRENFPDLWPAYATAVLPSSSKASTRMTVSEKAEAWAQALGM